MLLDIKMPGMDGLEVLRKLHALDETLPVVMISGMGPRPPLSKRSVPVRSTFSTSR